MARIGSLVLVCMAAAAQMPVGNWREDLAFLVKTLAAKHHNAFFAISQEEFARRAAAIEKRLPERSGDVQVISDLMQLVAAIGDGHTRLIAPIRRTLPVRVEWFRDGIYIVGARARERQLLGAKLEAIAGSPVEQVCRRMQLLVAHDNESQLKSSLPEFLVAADYLHAMGIVHDPRIVAISVRLTNKQLTTVELEAMPTDTPVSWVQAFAGSPPLAFANRTQPYWLALINGGKTVYVQYNSCREDPAYPIARFRSLLRQMLSVDDVQHLVVDLRHNVGGDSEVFAPVMDLIHASRFNAPGKLFVIIGRRTFSAAVLNAIRFRNETYAAFYGEPTGGRPNHYGHVGTFELPNSRLKVSYSTKYFRAMPGDPASLTPDVYIEPSFADYASGTDPVLDAILTTR